MGHIRSDDFSAHVHPVPAWQHTHFTWRDGLSDQCAACVGIFGVGSLLLGGFDLVADIGELWTDSAIMSK